MTQISSGTNIERLVPACAYCPTAPVRLTTRPGWSAVTVVYERLSLAWSSWACACARLAKYDRETINAIIDAGIVCQVGYVVDSQPYETPTNHWRIDDYV